MNFSTSIHQHPTSLELKFNNNLHEKRQNGSKSQQFNLQSLQSQAYQNHMHSLLPSAPLTLSLPQNLGGLQSKTTQKMNMEEKQFAYSNSNMLLSNTNSHFKEPSINSLSSEKDLMKFQSSLNRPFIQSNHININVSQCNEATSKLEQIKAKKLQRQVLQKYLTLESVQNMKTESSSKSDSIDMNTLTSRSYYTSDFIGLGKNKYTDKEIIQNKNIETPSKNGSLAQSATYFYKQSSPQIYHNNSYLQANMSLSQQQVPSLKQEPSFQQTTNHSNIYFQAPKQLQKGSPSKIWEGDESQNIFVLKQQIASLIQENLTLKTTVQDQSQKQKLFEKSNYDLLKRCEDAQIKAIEQDNKYLELLKINQELDQKNTLLQNKINQNANNTSNSLILYQEDRGSLVITSNPKPQQQGWTNNNQTFNDEGEDYNYQRRKALQIHKALFEKDKSDCPK